MGVINEYDSSSSPNAINNTDDKASRPLLDSSPEGVSISFKPTTEKKNVDNSNEQPNDVSVLIKDSSDTPVISAVEVKDKFYLIYIVFLLFGIATLLPWNIFITATSYFVDYKLNTTESFNATYRKDFTFYVGLVGQTTNVLMNFVNIFITFGGNPKNRIPYTIMLCAAVIVFQVALAIINSSTWPFTFFVLCCVSVFVMYVATGIMNSCVYYVASIFPMEYMNAIILGNNLSGIFTTVMSIGSKATSPDLKIAAIYYFLSAFVILMLAFVGYFLMHKTKFYRYHSELAEMRNEKANENQNQKQKVPYVKIIKKTWLLLFCIWLNFFSTLAIFPVFQLGVRRASDTFFIPDFWFQDIVTFLTFNVLVTIGNMIPKIIRKPGPKWIPVPVISRAVIVFIFFAFCNFMPDKRNLIPILITNDYVYWLGCAISPILFGYFTSLLMMYTPKQVEEQYAGSAAMIAALVLTIGVTTGLQFSKLLELIVLI